MERYDFGVHRGETFRKVLALKSRGEAVDLTGWTAKSQVRPEPDSPELVCEIGIEIIAAEGKIVLTVEPAVTEDLFADMYAWDIRITDAEGIAKYYLGGKFSVLPSVTV